MTDRTVWKYELDTDTILELPGDAKVLHVAAQSGPFGENRVCLWAEVDPSGPLRRRRFFVRGTGHPLPPDDLLPVHVGSFLTDPQGTYVFHVYESMAHKLASVAS